MGREGCGWGGFLLSGWVTLRKLSLLKKTSTQARSWPKVLGLIKESISFTKINPSAMPDLYCASKWKVIDVGSKEPLCESLQSLLLALGLALGLYHLYRWLKLGSACR